jgi:hypothetical protein
VHALCRLLDDNRELYVPELQEVVKPHPHFMLFATQNPPGIYAGRKTLSRCRRRLGSCCRSRSAAERRAALLPGMLVAHLPLPLLTLLPRPLRPRVPLPPAYTLTPPYLTLSPPHPTRNCAGPSAPASWSYTSTTSPTQS